MVEIDWIELRKKVPNVESLDLDNPIAVSDGDQITVFQHPLAGNLSSSQSSCVEYSK